MRSESSGDFLSRISHTLEIPMHHPYSKPFIGGNVFDKYRSKNPIHRWLMRRFLTSLRTMLSQIEFKSVLEVGCGPGDLASNIVPPSADYLGIDIDAAQIDLARSRYPQLKFEKGDAYTLPVEEKSYDLVIACEVLEHLEDPGQALTEIDRVTKQWVLISVPQEPMWRILNIARGKYLSDFGNTPGHIQHFIPRELAQLVAFQFHVYVIKSVAPWTVLLARKKHETIVNRLN